MKNKQGQSLVVSELAKGRGKLKKLSLLIKTGLTGVLSMCLASTALADIVVNNTDDFVIKEDNANSIPVDGKFTILDADEDIIVNNSGNIQSNGVDSTILYYNLNEGNLIDITNTGNLETSKDCSRGIVVYGKRKTNDREIKINNNGNITINGNGAAGIVSLTSDAAQNTSDAQTHTSVLINNSGEININNNKWIGNGDIKAGKYPAGIVAVALNGNIGDITVNNSGNINSSGHGIRAWQQGIDDINIDNSGIYSFMIQICLWEVLSILL
ncbi:MAG: hypothetical protein J6568_07045 [Snodgrassella sp.]|nr:hypothetical protein [Snodgrassella sp.]